MLQVAVNITFLEKSLKSKSGQESDSDVDFKSEYDDNNNNSTAISLHNSQKFEKPINNNKFANYSILLTQKKASLDLNGDAGVLKQ